MAEIKETITITFCDCAENHVGMQQLGKLSKKGFSLDDLIKIKEWYSDRGLSTELFDLNWPLESLELEPDKKAYFLVIRKGTNLHTNSDELMNQLRNLEWDSKAFMYGRVVNKKARYNLCFGNINQKPNYQQTKGRVYKFTDIQLLDQAKNSLEEVTGINSLVAEGNYYYDVNKCGIGFHGDSERRIVIGIRLGSTLQLEYQWYQYSNPVGERMTIELNNGDIYFMSEKAVGTDWKKKNIPTLRHATGCDKFVK
ncbi:hypothetical protein qu_164 [Acanthamoeba polyphaga mimivirus]|nr:hypothetical protein [Mimivirus reunion]WMV61502.1 hypothetical protein qu_164 [Mimivirus sp.]WMV62479.1 hypothetical protein qu_164 [Acanthamoeba polyphaga mimivirus]WMV63456.1 hypothetical protein qu_164 [Mimivirus sp.]